MLLRQFNQMGKLVKTNHKTEGRREKKMEEGRIEKKNIPKVAFLLGIKIYAFSP